MNREQFNALQKFEGNFNTAIHNGYNRNITNKDREIISGVYKALFNENPRLNCTNCLLEAFRKLGKAYYAYMDKQEPAFREGQEQEKPTRKKTTTKKDVKDR